MNPRCKQGDIAFVTRGPDAGAIVQCLEYMGRLVTTRKNGSEVLSHWWRVDKPLRKWTGEYCPEAEDEILRPLRDDPGPDEMLRIAGLPNQEKSHA